MSKGGYYKVVEKKLIPCDLGQIADSGQCFRMTKQDDNTYKIIATDKCTYAHMQGENLVLECSEQEFDEFWRDYFDFDTDYQKICDSVDENDEFLKASVKYGSGMRILKQELWEMLITFMISQNNNIPRIQKSVEAICEKFGREKTDNRGNKYFTFPTKDELAKASIEELRACGLGYRDRYLFEIAHSEFDVYSLKNMPIDEAEKALCKITGVGKKVANCVKLFGLHDLASFPIDTWIKKICDKYYNGSFPVERYKGYAGVIQQYIFFYGRTGIKL